MSELASAVDALGCEDLHALAEPTLLTRTETLIEVWNTLGAEIARSLQVIDIRDITVSECGRQTKAWLIEDQHLAPKLASSLLWVGRRLPAHPRTAAALAAGEITVDHAKLIIGCVTKLDPGVQDPVEAELVSFAGDHDPGLLAQLCQQVRVQTGADESSDAQALAKYDSRLLTLSPTFDGMTSIAGMLDPASAATLAAAITPLTEPTTDDDRSHAQRCADAVVELAQIALACGALSEVAGEPPHITITIPLTELLTTIPPARLNAATMNGQPISANTARMIACDAKILPAVLGGDSEILDLGRSRRHWTRAQRRARQLEDKRCTWPGCQVPLARCRIHHLDFYSRGGPTNHTNGTHLCPFHHWLVHHTNWTISRDQHGKIRVKRN